MIEEISLLPKLVLYHLHVSRFSTLGETRKTIFFRFFSLRCVRSIRGHRMRCVRRSVMLASSTVSETSRCATHRRKSSAFHPMMRMQTRTPISTPTRYARVFICIRISFLGTSKNKHILSNTDKHKCNIPKWTQRAEGPLTSCSFMTNM